MALTTIKTGGLADNSVTDAKVADAITVTGAQTGITQVGTLTAGTWNAGAVTSSGAVIATNFTATSGTPAFLMTETDTNPDSECRIVNGGGNLYIDGDLNDEIADSFMAFRLDNGSEKMRIDSLGTIFQGTTSPTLHSAVRGIVFENGSLLNDVTRGAGKSITLAQNVAIDSGNTWAYLATDEASYYQQFGGNHYFATCASGSAGADATLTSKLTILNAGNVGIGTTSPGQVLTIKHAEPTILFIHDSTEIGFIGDCANFLTGSSPASDSFGVRSTGDFRIGTGGNNLRMIIDSSGNSTFKGSITAEHSIAPEIMLNDTGGTSNRRIFRISGGGDVIHFEGRNNDNSGAGGVGGDGSIAMMSLAYGGLSIKGAFRDTTDNNPNQYQLSFGGDNTSNPRWGFRVGTSSTGEDLFLDGNLTSSSRYNALKIDKGDGTFYQTTTFASGTNKYVAAFSSNNAYEFIVNGDDRYYLFNTWQTSWSDRNLKKNIASITGGLDICDKLNPVTFNWKKEWAEGDAGLSNRKFYGIIAQELQEVLPELVYEGKDKLMVQRDELQWILLAAVKELSAKVKTLESA